MAKRNPTMALAQDERGQISIFFSASLVVLITIVAFVINVGLFVKAKVNLHNATDAAAFAGAAVQSRQLTKIAYLNWEMRNVYKEWLYKYYVIGNLNLPDVENPGTSGHMKFQLANDVNVLTGDEVKDPFNIPAVCIHIAGSKTNICKRYSIPGLPEFGSTNLSGAEEASRAFMDALISTKVDDCVERTKLNMMVTNTWTYNVLGRSSGDSLVGRGPAILADRQGAWPRAVELAVRIRNLEKIMNAPAVTAGVCNSGSTAESLTNCSRSIDEVMDQGKLGNERLVKAFYSGYRNLGNLDDSEMKNSFTLREIPPTSVPQASDNNASNLLIPSNKKYDKQWVDLKLMMVNYAVFFAAMIPRADSSSSGACDVSKVAIPVPGYPLGFYKAPEVVTYYAVKGEAEFVGMFNPFGKAVKMTAYSAAKPFGGRIGPMLFTQREGQDYIVGRTDENKRRSIPYITSYDFAGVQIRKQGGSGVDPNPYDGSNFRPGIPLPTNSTTSPGSFWLERDDSPLGGKLADATAIQFGVPNLVYDYENGHSTAGYSTSGSKIFKIVSATGVVEPVGLFSKHQFNKFKGGTLSATISPDDLDAQIARVRAPTSYEAANYLIPTPNDFNLASGLDSFGFINGEGQPLATDVSRTRSTVYAPLYRTGSDEVIFGSAGEVRDAIFEFMGAQETGMQKYKMAMNMAAYQVFKQKTFASQSAVNSAQGYLDAARKISSIPLNDGISEDQVREAVPVDCKSLTGQFLYFYYEGIRPNLTPADTTGCPVSLHSLFLEYFSGDSDHAFEPDYYHFDHSWPGGANDEKKKYLTGYMPGPFTGVSPDGQFTSPIPGSGIVDNMRRNSYSTKFVTLESLLTGGTANYGNTQFGIYSEGEVTTTDDTKQNGFRNVLKIEEVGGDISSIKY